MKFKAFIFFCNTVIIFFLLLSLLAPYLVPKQFWPIALLGIGFPILFLCNAACIIFWMFFNRKRCLLSLVALFFCIPAIVNTCAFHPGASFNEVKPIKSLRVLTWNVGLMNYTQADSNVAIANNAFIFQKIKSSNADVVCLQEFFSSVVGGNHYNLIDSISRTLGYKNYYFSRDNPKFDGQFFNGTIIFSRYQILDTQKIIYPPPFVGSIIKASVSFNNDTIDIFSTRFQSVNFTSNEYKELHNIKKANEDALQGSKNIIQKLRRGYSIRKEEVVIAKNFLMQSNRPLVFTGDFNDVPISFTYHTLKGGLSDAWLTNGFGLGRTFKFIYPTLRIDNIFFNDHFTALQVKRILSGPETDHHAVVCDLRIKKSGN